MKIVDIIVLILFAVPSVGHLWVYTKKPEGPPSRATVWGVLLLCGVSLVYAGLLIGFSRFY